VLALVSLPVCLMKMQSKSKQTNNEADDPLASADEVGRIEESAIVDALAGFLVTLDNHQIQ
jgi:hypothetical protein